MSRTYWTIAILLTLLSCAVAAWFYTELPQRVPTHWNWEGKVDGWGDKSLATLLMPGTMVGMLLFFVFLPALSPRQFEVDTFRSTYLYIMVLTIGFFAYMNAIILLQTWQELRGGTKFLDFGRAMIAGICLFIGLLGKVMGKVRRNFYIGIRVPWTLASDRVWDDTHRLATWVMVAAGLIGFVLVVAGFTPLAAFALLIGSLFIPVVYSFVHYKALERSGQL